MDHDADKGGLPAGDGPSIERLVGFEPGKSKARKLFEHAHKAEETRNYDYAIELYVQGLSDWPDAVDEGLKKLRVVATARRMAGGKPPGFMTARKYPVGGKDVVKSLNNALHLFGLNPTDVSYMESILQLAAKTGCDAVGQWIAPVLADAYNTGKKLSAARYQSACAAMERIADLAASFDNDTGAMEMLRAEVATTQIWQRHHPDSAEAIKTQGNASGKLAIVKGQFAKADGFEGSLKDADEQHDLHDRDKQMHTSARHKELIERARKDWEANRDVANKLLKLVELMLRVDSENYENEAIRLLKEEYTSSENYIFKQKEDELQIRLLNRRLREITEQERADPSNPDIRNQRIAHQKRQNEIETQIYEDRVKHYPTDLRVKYELGLRLFQARRYDEAIPLFQQSRSDARIRAESRLYIGRCFYGKQFFDQAMEVLRRGVSELQTRTGAVAMNLNYWLARTLEASKETEEARKVYGHLIQLDYNFLDARMRLEKLVKEQEK